MSFLFGKIARIERPKWLAQLILTSFKKYFKIDTTEARKSNFASLYDLFTREIKERKIESKVIHPVDGELVSFGKIKNNQIFLIKGKNYSLTDLVGDDLKNTGEGLEGFYFYNYYLSPTDYHRVHHPVSGEYRTCYPIKGALYPVAPWFVKLVPSVFAKNYRTVSKIENNEGSFYTIMVGALNVGSIEMVRGFFKFSDKKVEVGDHLGTFALGSSVVFISPVRLNAEEGRVKFTQSLEVLK